MSDTEALVYVVDDDPSVRESLADLLDSVGLKTKTFASGQEFLITPRPQVPSCLVLDVNLPGLSGLDLQQELDKSGAQIPIIFLTGHGDIPMSVRAVKAGAVEFLTKPFDEEDLLNAIQQCIAVEQKEKSRNEISFGAIVGNSPALKGALGLVQTVAPTDSTVLVLGETGTGKELIARAIHDHSSRQSRAFVKLNCAAIPFDLLESELFGHEKGAFTGAIAQKIGRFELADRGTLFLDEVGDIPLALQAKLLRVLQEQEFERLGSTHTKKVDARLIAATNRDLGKMVAEGHFREDLYYRLAVFPITVPSLRERREDIPLLVEHFVARYAQRMRKTIKQIPQSALQAITEWPWPGNVRELQNFIERSVILTKGEGLEVPLQELRPWRTGSAIKDADDNVTRGADDNLNLRNLEREAILEALRKTQGRLGGASGAAAMLGLKRTTLQSRMRILDIKMSHEIADPR